MDTWPGVCQQQLKKLTMFRRAKLALSFLGSRRCYVHARGSLTEPAASLPPIFECPKEVFVERARTFLNPRWGQEFLLRVVNSANILSQSKKTTIREWISEDFPQEKEGTFNTGFVSLLLHLCKTSDDPKCLCALLSVIKKHKLILKEGDIGNILVTMSRYGWRESVKVNFYSMTKAGFDFRISVLHYMVKDAIQAEDLEFAADVMHKMISVVVGNKEYPKKDLAMEEVMKVCVGKGDVGLRLVEQLLEWHRVVHDVTEEEVDALVQWLHR